MDTIALSLDTKLYQIAKQIDNVRVKKHLRRIEASLRKKIDKNVPQELLQIRHQTLDNLRDYWQTGEFPVNNKLTVRTAVFKDEFGTYCAVGNLLAKGGYDNYVSEIQASNNYIRVHEMSDSKHLDALKALGLSKKEAIRIQPTYGYEGPGLDGAPDKTTLAMFKLVSLVMFILLQLFAIFFFKEMNLARRQKLFGYLTLLMFSSLIMTAIWSLFALLKAY